MESDEPESEAEFAADGDTVVEGIDPPTDDELLDYLAAQGWTEDGPPG